MEERVGIGRLQAASFISHLAADGVYGCGSASVRARLRALGLHHFDRVVERDDRHLATWGFSALRRSDLASITDGHLLV